MAYSQQRDRVKATRCLDLHCQAEGNAQAQAHALSAMGIVPPPHPLELSTPQLPSRECRVAHLSSEVAPHHCSHRPSPNFPPAPPPHAGKHTHGAVGSDTLAMAGLTWRIVWYSAATAAASNRDKPASGTSDTYAIRAHARDAAEETSARLLRRATRHMQMHTNRRANWTLRLWSGTNGMRASHL